MIQSWKLANFKSVYALTELSFSPLTVFAGANSSGKSTFIQSMLLVAQTIDNQVFSKPVVLNGNIVRLGTFDDLASTNSGENEISIGFSLAIKDYERILPGKKVVTLRRLPRYTSASELSVSCDFSFSAETGAETETRELLQLQPVLTKCKLQVTSDKHSKPFRFEMRRYSGLPEEHARKLCVLPENISPADLPLLQYEVLAPKQIKHERISYGKPTKGKPAGCRLAHFLPIGLSVAYDSIEEYARQVVNNFSSEDPADFDRTDIPFLGLPLLEKLREILDAGAQQAQPTHPERSPFSEIRNRRFTRAWKILRDDLTPKNLLKAISLYGQRRFRLLVEPHEKDLIKLAKGDQPQHKTFVTFPPQDELQNISHSIRTEFSESFKYLGPLRDEPKAVYPMEGVSDPGDVGLKGQYTAAVLDLHKATLVQYIPSRCFLEPGALIEKEISSLKDAIQDWMNYLKVVRMFNTVDRGIFGHELQVATGSSDDLHNISHVGVGVSQVLPILVMSLLADSGSILVFEQPEIHLNPKVQTLIADFLLSMILLDKQCIVETHSEYLINRLRYRAAVDTGDTIANLMKLYFVENKEGHSQYRQVSINEYGAIDEWPEGFFDETPGEAERILRAAMIKRSNSRKKNA